MRKFFLTNIFLFLTIALNAQWTQINFPLTNEQINAIVYVDNYILTELHTRMGLYTGLLILVIAGKQQLPDYQQLK